MYHEMTVYGFTIDVLANRPVVILKDSRDNNAIPIWISTTEAFVIAAELVFLDSSTKGRDKDLMALFLEKSGTEIGAIAIENLSDGVFTASVRFVRGTEEYIVDVRPCEAILAALRYKMPILIADEVLRRASALSMSGEGLAGESNARRFAEFLENLDPSTLGKYPM